MTELKIEAAVKNIEAATGFCLFHKSTNAESVTGE